MSIVCGKYFPDSTERVNNDTFVCFPHRVGKNILLCGRKASSFPFQLFVGPEWSCMIVTYCLIIVPTIFFLLNVARKLGTVVIVLGIFLGLSTLIFFTFTACSDPGIVFIDPNPEQSRCCAPDTTSQTLKCVNEDKDSNVSSTALIVRSSNDETNHDVENPTKTPEENIFENLTPSSSPSVGASSALIFGGSPLPTLVECSLCKIMRPRCASHCYECGLCIEELDHHCPWTGKCIGKKNIDNFHRFLASLACLILFVLICVFIALSRHQTIT